MWVGIGLTKSKNVKGYLKILIFQRHSQANIPFTTMDTLNYLKIVGFYGQLAIAMLLVINCKS